MTSTLYFTEEVRRLRWTTGIQGRHLRGSWIHSLLRDVDPISLSKYDGSFSGGYNLTLIGVVDALKFHQ